MPTDPIRSEIVTPPPNEPQPDRESQLENDLSKLFDIPVESKPEVKEPAKETHKDIEKPEESPQESPDKGKVQEPEKTEIKDIKPTSKEGWKILKESHAKAKKEILEKDQELAKLKTSLAEKGQVTSQEAENLKKEIEELKSYRAMIDIQADPEFISKFDNPILEKQKEVHDILTAFGVSEDVINNIDYTNSQAISLAAHAIRKETNDDIAAEDFMSAAREARSLILKRDKQLQEHKSKYKEVLENKKKETFTKQAENEGRTQKHIQTIAEMKNEKGEFQFPFLSEITAKDPTNPSEIEQVDRHNKAVALLRHKLDGALKAESPEERAEVAIAAVSAHWTSAQLRAALKKIESLQSELAKVSKVTSDTPKSQRTKFSEPNNGTGDLDLDSALSNFMAKSR